MLIGSGGHNKKTIDWRLQQLKLISHSSGAGKFKMKVLGDWVSGEVSLSGLQVAVFSLCPHRLKRALWYLFFFL